MHSQIKLQHLLKVWIWTFEKLIHKINSLQEVLILEQNFQNKKVGTGKKLCSLWYIHFALPILFVLTLSSDRAVLCGNVVFLILVLSTKRQYSSFLKKVFVFQKISFKVLVLRTFKISSDSHIKNVDLFNGYFGNP